MGATTFSLQPGQNPDAAFSDAVAEALYEYGHNGYTGTVAKSQATSYATAGNP